MIISYKANMAGPYHIEAGLPCQDSFAIREGRDSYIIAAVADGLGSELYSDIGSAVAASTAVDYCAERISEGMSFDNIKKIMNNAMVHAYKAVLSRAEQDTNAPDEYDTTLCLCAYNGEHLYYGQSGDSGIVVLLQSGEYRRVTTQQRDEDGCVFPLCWGPDKWEFGYLENSVSSVMLMTDGVFEQVCPPVMRGKEIDINIPLARKFMDRFDCNEELVTALESAAYRYLENYPRNLLDDDKTVVVIINTANPAKVMPETYYAVPNWKALREEAEKKLVVPDDTVASDDIADDIAPVTFEDQHEAIIQEDKEDMSTDSASHVDLDHADKDNDEVKKNDLPINFLEPT